MDEPKSIKVTLKSGSASQGKEIEISEADSIKTMREKVVEVFKTEQPTATASAVVLIYGGKILKDDATVKASDIKNGHKVHVVFKGIKKPAATSSASSTATPTSTTATPSTAAAPTQSSNPAPTTTAPAGAGGLANMFGTNLSSGNMQEMQNELMRNPEMMSQIMNNPLMQSVLSDPNVMREMINANPQLRNLMESQPQVRQMLENPDTLRSMMDMARNPARMQEMMRHQDQAMQHLESIPGGRAHLENMFRDVVEPMQNATSVNPFEQLANNNNTNSGADNATSQTETTSALPNPWAAPQNNNAARSGQAPQMTDGLRSAMMNSILSNVPGGAGIPEGARERMAGLFGNPAAMQAMQRPAVREAMTQIQQGVATLTREAPELAEIMGIPNMGNMGAMGNMGNMGLGAMGGLGGAPAPAAPAAPADTRPPEERWATQLEQLSQMGFTQRQQNIAALQRTNGNVNMAIELLLNGGFM